MATKAKTTSRTRSAKPAATRTSAAKTARTSTKSTIVRDEVVTPVAAVRPVTKQKTYFLSDDLSGAQVIGEMVGTFLLVAMVTATGGNAFLVGVALAVIVAMVFNISGAHVNPAVTLGLFVMRKVSATKMIFYWMAQFVGAIAAILAVSAFSRDRVSISLASFTQWDWRVVFAEMIGMAIFMFAIAAAANRGQTDNDKAAVIGLALFVALLVSGNLLQQAAAAASSSATDAKNVPRITKLNGTTLNPAVALSLNETDTTSSMMGGNSTKTGPSRLTLETILGTFLGAAIGGRLYMLLARNTEEGRV